MEITLGLCLALVHSEKLLEKVEFMHLRTLRLQNLFRNAKINKSEPQMPA